MAKEKNDEMMVETEAGKVDTVTGEVKEADANKDVEKEVSKDYFLKDLDAFEDRRGEEGNGGSAGSENSVVYDVPMTVKRWLSNEKDGRKYYNYALKYALSMRGKEIEQTVFLEPSAKLGDVYDLLDVIFGDEISCPLQIVKTSRTTTQNGVQKTTHTYSARVSYADDAGTEISCPMTATRGNSLKFDNLIAKLKSAGYVH